MRPFPSSAVLVGSLLACMISSHVAADDDVYDAAVRAVASTEAEKARQGRLSFQLDQVADAHESHDLPGTVYKVAVRIDGQAVGDFDHVRVGIGTRPRRSRPNAD